MKSKHSHKGFNLIELMVTLVIVAILAALVGPGFQNTLERSAISSLSERLGSTLQFARAEAVRTGKTVSICSSTDQASCAGAGDWVSGWLIFVDEDGDGALELNDQLLKVEEGGRDGYDVVLISSSPSTFGFNSQGFAVATGAFQVCGPSGESTTAKGIVIRGAGSMRQAVDTNDDGVREDHEGSAFQC